MDEFFNEKDLEKNIKIEPHDYSKDIERLDQKMRKNQFSYIDAVMNQVKNLKRRAITLLVVGIAIAIATILLSDFFPAYDMESYIFLNSILGVGYNPILSILTMLIPIVIVFTFLVWLYNREVKMYLYLAQKSKVTSKKAGFVTMLIEPFLLLVSAIISSILFLSLFSFFGCNQLICNFFGNTDKLSSNLLFNLLTLSFYLIFLGLLQLKRYLDLAKLGIRDFYKDIKL